MTTNGLAYLPASELADRIRAGDLSPVAVVDAFLDRIERLDGEINAYTTVRAEAARDEAREAALAVENGGPLGPLHGVPVAVKDLTRVRGTRTTFGSPVYEDHVPERDDTVVRRLREAGAIVLGKTNTPAFGRKTVTDNPVFGRTNNPWDLGRTVGGSSGGSAAAVAAGLAPLALGSDAAGSIRIPSSACGVFGLLPDVGRVPAGPTRSDAFQNLLPYTFLGPIARSVEDAALMLDAIAGPDGADPHSLPAPDESYRTALGSDASDLRVGYLPEFGDFTVSSEVRRVVDAAVEQLEAAGAEVEEVDLDSELSWTEKHDALDWILQSRYIGLYEDLKRNEGVDLLDTDLPITPEVRSRVRKGLDRSTTDLAEARRRRTTVYDEIRATLDGYDVLATPTLARTPFEHDTDDVTVGGESVHDMHGWTLTWPLNLSGHPAGSVPVGIASDGLPVGLQVIAPRRGDRDVVRACNAIEDALPWRESYPPSDVEEL
ncbi:amidase [Halorussus litoreus]|uniref:amidase n=1 Tax=Halorussus litoreus TaxID=1710536 RepID=UPI000E225EF1|nr:amidase [Halorussus litoreus]